MCRARYCNHATGAALRGPVVGQVEGQTLTVVFVHGCFRHQHPSCAKSTLPATNREFWVSKLRRNAERDHEQAAALEQAGWRVRVVWECESRDAGRLADLADEIRRP